MVIIEPALALGFLLATPLAVGFGFGIAERIQKKKAENRLRGLSFGIGLVDQHGNRSRLEHFLIQALRKQGATCVLAGRQRVLAKIAEHDVIDGVEGANPIFAIIGTVSELLDETTVARDAHTERFLEWVFKNYKKAFNYNCCSWEWYDESRLARHYSGVSCLSDLYAPYRKECGAEPYRRGATVKITACADCHCADGTVMASYHIPRTTTDDDLSRNELFEKIAEQILDELVVSEEVYAIESLKTSPGHPSFTREVMDGLVRLTYTANNPGATDALPDPVSPTRRAELIAADQPYQSQD